MFPVPEASVPAVEICSERSDAGITVISDGKLVIDSVLRGSLHEMPHLSQQERPYSSPRR